MIKQIATVAVYVDDQQKAKTFWSEKSLKTRRCLSFSSVKMLQIHMKS